MAKAIVVAFNGEESSFAFAKLDRSRLYGARRRVPLDQSGLPCTKAALTVDGLYLLQAGMTAQGYFDETGRWVQRHELVGLTADGNALELKPSTLGVAQSCEHVSPEIVLTQAVNNVYVLDPIKIHETLMAELNLGNVFRFDFNYSADYRTEIGFIVKNDEGIFALICEPVTAVWCEPGKPTFVEEAEESADELDFDMF